MVCLLLMWGLRQASSLETDCIDRVKADMTDEILASIVEFRELYERYHLEVRCCSIKCCELTMIRKPVFNTLSTERLLKLLTHWLPSMRQLKTRRMTSSKKCIE